MTRHPAFVVLACAVEGAAALSARAASAPPASQAQEFEPLLSFDQALETILGRSLDLAAQSARSRQVNAQATAARAAILPSITLDASQTVSANIHFPSSRTRVLEGTARLNLFRSGADIAGIHAANADQSRQGSVLESETLRAESGAIEALLDRIERLQQRAVYEKILKTRAESLRIARARYQRGFLPQQEVDKVEIDAANAEAQLRNAENEAVNSAAALGALLGHARVQSEWPWKEALVRAKMPQFQPETLPDIKAAATLLRAEESRLNQRSRVMFPSLDASYTYGTYGPPSSLTPAWSAGLTLTLPLFDRLVNYTAYRTQAETRTLAEIALERTEREAQNEYEAAISTFQTARSTAQARSRTLLTSRKLYDDNLKRFEAGRITANDFLQDQNRLFESELLELQGWRAAHATFARLCHAAGSRVASCFEK